MKWLSWRTLDELIKGFLWSIPITITFCDLVGCVAKVEGHSMSPVVNPKAGTSVDFVWVDRLSLLFKGIQRGQVVVLVCPYNKNKKLIKRVVALEGDHIWSRAEHRLTYIPLGHCWVEGDEGDKSTDSNQLGPIPQALIEGRVGFIIWPWKRWGRVPQELQRSSKDRLIPSKVV